MRLIFQISFLLLCHSSNVLSFAPPTHNAPRLCRTQGSVSVASRHPWISTPNNNIDGHLFLPSNNDYCRHQKFQQAGTSLRLLPPTSVAIATEQMIAWSSMGILAVQFGVMPTLQKKCVSKKLCRSSMVLAQEFSKFCLSALCLLLLLSPAQRQELLVGWSVRTWWQLAGIPAALYAIQNYAKLMAYQHLPPVTYSVLNQTKTLSAAFFCYLLLGIPQSVPQMASLCLLLLSALTIEGVVKIRNITRPMWNLTTRLSSLHWTSQAHLQLRRRRGQATSKLFTTIPFQDRSLISSQNTNNLPPKDHQQQQPVAVVSVAAAQQRDPYHFTRGVLPIMLANLTSGLAAALGQRALQQQRRNLYLYGMELSSASCLLVILSLLCTKDGKQLQQEGLVKHWTPQTWLPIAAHALGGLLVGIVTKYAGSVKKGFALIFGVLLSGLFQRWISREPVTREQILGGILACMSLWMHSSFPPPAR